MIGVFRCEQAEPTTVEVHAVQVFQVGIAARFTAAGGKVEHAIVLIDVPDSPNDPRTARNLVFQGSGFSVVEIQMHPAVAFRRPKHFGAVVDEFRLHNGVSAEEGVAFFSNDGMYRAADTIDLPQLAPRIATVAQDDGRTLTIGFPIEPRTAVVL